MSADKLLISVGTSPASDSWGFVGTVSVGDHEAYRTIRAYDTPQEALDVTQVLIGEVLGALLAGQEWRLAQQEFGHAPRRVDLSLGLRGLRGHGAEAPDVPSGQVVDSPADPSHPAR